MFANRRFFLSVLALVTRMIAAQLPPGFAGAIRGRVGELASQLFESSN